MSQGRTSGGVRSQSAGRLLMVSAFAGASSASIQEGSAPTDILKVHFPTGGLSCATISDRKWTHTMATLLDHDDGAPSQSF